MDPIEDLILHSFSDEDSTDDMELEHSNDELYVTNSDIGGIDMTKSSGSPSVELRFSPSDNDEHYTGICPNMPWDDKPKVVERWLQMYQVCSLINSMMVSQNYPKCVKVIQTLDNNILKTSPIFGRFCDKTQQLMNSLLLATPLIFFVMRTLSFDLQEGTFTTQCLREFWKMVVPPNFCPVVKINFSLLNYQIETLKSKLCILLYVARAQLHGVFV